MRRLILSTFSLVLLTIFSFGVANAQPDVSLPLRTVNVGNSVNVAGTLSNNIGARTFGANIAFNANIVSVNIINMSVEIMPGSALNGTNFQVQASQTGGPGTPILVGVFNTSSDNAVIPNGEIFVIPFNGDNEGSSDLTFSNAIFEDNQGMPVQGSTMNGRITVEGLGPGNVSITKTADRDRVPPGELVNITYTITIDSNGAVAAQDVMVSDELPPESELVDATAGCMEPILGVVECEVGTLPVNEERVFEITISITPEGASIFNEAIVEFLGGENSSSAIVNIGGTGGGGSCALASHTSTSNSAVNIILLLMPALVIGFVRFRKYKIAK